MTTEPTPLAARALDVAPRARASSYPEPFASRMAGRQKRALGDVFGLANFGVNLTRLAPGGESALRHAHSRQDEFVYVLSGKLILTEPNGTRHEYLPGDSLVLPVGYTGTWEMQGNYRELVVLAQKSN